MITDLFLSIVLMTLMYLGVSRPHFAVCAVIWVDLVKPQNLSFSFLSGKPLSLLVTAYFFGVLFLKFKDIKKPNSGFFLFIIPLFGIWVTISTFNALFLPVAWLKYDVVIKTLLMVYFIPFVLYDRKHFEFFLITCALSFGMFLTMAGVKSILSGGGYGISLVGINGFMYSEGSTLAALSVCLIPIYLYLYKWSLFAVQFPKVRFVFIFFLIFALATLIGTQARTGLIALAMYCMIILSTSKKKFRDIFVMLLMGLMMLPFVTDGWKTRMSSIDEGATTEKSALGRLVVWRWTLDFVADRPFFGGGFYAHNANAGVLHYYQKAGEEPIIQEGGKAFHNIFFEVLGETGYGGLLIFCSIILHTLYLNFTNRNKKEEWHLQMSKAINISLVVYCTGGLFIGVAFYPWIYYLHAFSVALNTQRKGT